MNGDRHWQQSHTWNEILSQSDIWQTVLDELSHSKQLERIVSSSNGQSERIFIGCGTSFYLAEAAALSWALLTGCVAKAFPASEVLLYPMLIRGNNSNAQAVVISRSGRTSEAVRAANMLRQDLDTRVLGITCANGSELEHACDEAIVLHAADEKSMVMTRSFTSMLLSLQFLAALHANNAKFIDSLRAMAKEFRTRIPSIAEEMKEFVGNHRFTDYVFLAQGPFYGIAREAALKVMEMSCSYSQFFHTLEFRHGPKAIVSPSTCLTFLLSDSGFKAEVEVMEEMKELGGVNIAICNKAGDGRRQTCDLLIEMNWNGDELALLAPYTVPCQLLGFFTGIGKGLNPDVPKNLSRVVILD